MRLAPKRLKIWLKSGRQIDPKTSTESLRRGAFKCSLSSVSFPLRGQNVAGKAFRAARPRCRAVFPGAQMRNQPSAASKDKKDTGRVGGDLSTKLQPNFDPFKHCTGNAEFGSLLWPFRQTLPPNLGF